MENSGRGHSASGSEKFASRTARGRDESAVTTMRMAATGDAGKLQLIQKGLTLLYQPPDLTPLLPGFTP